MNALIKVSNLSVSFFDENDTCPVQNANFELFPGETLALVGESGSGKSITAKQILGLLPRYAECKINGSVFYKGIDLTKLSERKMRRIRGKEISIVFQDSLSALNPIMTVGAQIREAIRAHTDLSKNEIAQKASDLLIEVGLFDTKRILGCYPHELSGGQRQRIMIAMAISCNPQVLIADEPTTALDITTQNNILYLFKQLKEKNNLSILFITHDLKIVSGIADRVAVIYAGRIVEVGTKEQIFQFPMHPYTKLLVSLIPSEEHCPKGILPTLNGVSSLLNQRVIGCPFAERCKYTMRICSFHFPYQHQSDEGHRVFCWLYQKNIISQFEESKYL